MADVLGLRRFGNWLAGWGSSKAEAQARAGTPAARGVTGVHASTVHHSCFTAGGGLKVGGPTGPVDPAMVAQVQARLATIAEALARGEGSPSLRDELASIASELNTLITVALLPPDSPLPGLRAQAQALGFEVQAVDEPFVYGVRSLIDELQRSAPANYEATRAQLRIAEEDLEGRIAGLDATRARLSRLVADAGSSLPAGFAEVIAQKTRELDGTTGVYATLRDDVRAAIAGARPLG